MTPAVIGARPETAAKVAPREWAARPGHDTPPLSDYAVSREGIYEGHP